MVKITFWVHVMITIISSVAGGDGECPAESCEALGAWDAPDDEFSWCNVGSACRDDFRKANGSEYEIWPELNPEERKSRMWTEKNRLKLNEYQPMMVPKFTEVGYKKEKLNPETYAFLRSWYFSAKMNAVDEPWRLDNTYVNHWNHKTTMVRAPSWVDKRLYEDMQTLMEEWSGLELKPTACYGARSYYRGSVLANHVDRVDTHVVSAIINIDQVNVDEEWPLYVRGHDGVARNLFIQPGEVIFYESASVTHGRPEAFQGDSFTNIFIHFAPVKGWDVTGKDIEKAAREGAQNKSRKAREAKMKNEGRTRK